MLSHRKRSSAGLVADYRTEVLRATRGGGSSRGVEALERYGESRHIGNCEIAPRVWEDRVHGSSPYGAPAYTRAAENLLAWPEPLDTLIAQNAAERDSRRRECHRRHSNETARNRRAPVPRCHAQGNARGRA
jgi:hypothetical protein